MVAGTKSSINHPYIFQFSAPRRKMSTYAIKKNSVRAIVFSHITGSDKESKNNTKNKDLGPHH